MINQILGGVYTLKKAYSLNYDIERDTDRVAAVKDILDSLQKDPSPTELEQMGFYILCGKDENGYNAIQRGEITDSNKRYSSFKRMDDKNISLNEVLENPMADQQSLKPATSRYIYKKPKTEIHRPKYDKNGNLKDIGDGDIPGMQELWETIDRIEKVIAINEGKLPQPENFTLLRDQYRLYQLKHALIDLRRHQYYLKDSYKPTIHFTQLAHPAAAFYDWTSDASYWMPFDKWQDRVSHAKLHTISRNIEDYETRNNGAEVKWVVRRHTFDWENPKHVRALINNYDLLSDYVHDKLDTYSRTLIFDFERYRAMAALSPVRSFILDKTIERVSYANLSQLLQITYGLVYNENRLSTIISHEIPEKIAAAVKKHRLAIDTPLEEKKKCIRCGRYLPRDALFFTRNKNRPDGFSNTCKECEKQKRILRGGQSQYDRRSKETTLYEMS